MEQTNRIAAALGIASGYGSTDGAHHKAWVIDQMVRALTGCPTITITVDPPHGPSYSYEGYGECEEYHQFVALHNEGEDGPETYEWDEGIAP